MCRGWGEKYECRRKIISSKTHTHIFPPGCCDWNLVPISLSMRQRAYFREFFLHSLQSLQLREKPFFYFFILFHTRTKFTQWFTFSFDILGYFFFIVVSLRFNSYVHVQSLVLLHFFSFSFRFDFRMAWSHGVWCVESLSQIHVFMCIIIMYGAYGIDPSITNQISSLYSNNNKYVFLPFPTIHNEKDRMSLFSNIYVP